METKRLASASRPSTSAPRSPSASHANFQRLQQLCQIVMSTREKIDRLRADNETEHFCRFLDAHAQVGCEETAVNAVRLLRQTVEHSQRKVAALRSGVAEQRDRASETVDKLKHLNDGISDFQNDASRTESKNESTLSSLVQCRSWLRIRRCEMVNALLHFVFPIELNIIGRSHYFTDGSSAKKSQCTCSNFDRIAGAHLPRTVDVDVLSKTHSEYDVWSALGHVAHFLRELHLILDLPCRHDLRPMGSHSSIVSAMSQETLPLYGWKSRAERRLLATGWSLLDDCIDQLAAATKMAPVSPRLPTLLALFAIVNHILMGLPQADDVSLDTDNELGRNFSTSELRAELANTSPVCKD